MSVLLFLFFMILPSIVPCFPYLSLEKNITVFTKLEIGVDYWIIWWEFNVQLLITFKFEFVIWELPLGALYWEVESDESGA